MGELTTSLMYTKFDTNQLMYNIISDAGISITGKIYIDENRPVNSTLEDIVINTIDVTNATPQRATSNVLIFVPDIMAKGNKTSVKIANTQRLESLSRQILSLIENATTPSGISLLPSPPNIIAEDTMSQHYAGIRISWVIAPQIPINQ